MIIKNENVFRSLRHRYNHMIRRCYDENNRSYHSYGARGIRVCQRWKDNFWNYVNDLPKGHSIGLELDRIDNNGDYEPDNVRWATRAQQSRNRRSNKFIEFDGKTQCVADWAKEIGISQSSLDERLQRGWSLKDALTQPKGARLHNRWDGHIKKPEKPKRNTKLYDYKKQRLTMKQLSEMSGVPVKLLRKRIDERGWTVERAMETP